MTHHRDVDEGVEAGGSPLIRVVRVEANNAEQHGDPVVVDVQEEEVGLKEGHEKKRLALERERWLGEEGRKERKEWNEGGERKKKGFGRIHTAV